MILNAYLDGRLWRVRGDFCDVSGALPRRAIGLRLLMSDAREEPLVLVNAAADGRAVVGGALAAAEAAFFLLFSSSSRAAQSHPPESHLFRTIWKPLLLNF